MFKLTQKSRIVFAIASLLVGTAASAQCPRPPDKNPAVVYESDSFLSHAIPFAELLANPEKYDGKRVLLFGVFGEEIGGLSIYSDADSMRHSILVNGVFVNAQLDQRLVICRLLGKWGLVQGTFRAIRGDVSLGFAGQIENVSRVRPMPQRPE